MYKFSEYSKSILNLNKVVLVNKGTGQWIKISKEVYDILNLGIDNNLSLENLKKSLYDDEDREYISNLYNKLCFIGIIEDRNNKQNLKNKIASFEITNKCNLKCIHCCIDADGVNSDKKDLSTLKIKEALDKLIKWEPERIMLSGGEPMLRSDFLEVISYLRLKYDGKIIVSTNGTLINESNVDTLTRCVDQIDISLDGVDEETCSAVRGHGVFNKVLKSIKLIQSKGFRKISLSMAVADKNEHLEEEFNLLNSRLETTPIVRIFSPVGRGKENKEYFSDNTEDTVYIPNTFLSDDYEKNISPSSCSAGEREIFVRYNGDLYPCPSFMDFEFLIGNIFDIESIYDVDKSFTQNIKNYSLLNKYNKEQYEKCIDCKVNLFCWTCPGELESLKLNKAALEYRCKILKPVLYKRVWGE